MSPRAALFLLLLVPPPTAGAADEVVIYRCTAADGALTLRDSPCLAGERQETRSMQRPAAAPARPPATPAPPAVAPPPAVPAPPRTIVYRTPPRPMYECVGADGQRYSSDNGEGRPRWVPYWTLGYPGWRHPPRPHDPHPPVRPPGGTPGSPRPPPSRPPLVAVPAGGAWVRDECHPLPQAEVCARLSDRRYEILRRYHGAMQSERRELDLEQRAIDARIANDCGNPR
ncbi:hypothetical protein [Pseudoxanthomonas mexicana]|uniref:hypothetical protein n=1 Tax=Pseudoxanthomonas mexicana TaxID=128785 RepID=UPI00398ABE4E